MNSVSWVLALSLSDFNNIICYRVEHFFGRSELLQVIKQHVFGTSKYPFILYGKRGVGLTSLVAKLALDFYNSIPRCVRKLFTLIFA